MTWKERIDQLRKWRKEGIEENEKKTESKEFWEKQNAGIRSELLALNVIENELSDSQLNSECCSGEFLTRLEEEFDRVIKLKRGEINDSQLLITLPNKEKFILPMIVVALNHANHFKNKFGMNLDRSLNDNSLPMFANEPHKAKRWLQDNMIWEDIELHVRKINNVIPYHGYDYSYGFLACDINIVRVADYEKV